MTMIIKRDSKTVDYEIVVIGAGHAGLEAAYAASRIGARVLLVTKSLTDIGAMSCNPSIGGVGKGILVKEIDALDGIMPKAADSACIHYKTLNNSKGPAVHGPRMQIDRFLYSSYIRNFLKENRHITLAIDEVIDITLIDRIIRNIKLLKHGEITCKFLVIATGTFLRAKTFTGNRTNEHGRIGDRASNALADQIRKMGLKMGRFKTGTPARIAKATIDYSRCDVQLGDEDIIPFSYETTKINPRQIACYITYTNPAVHQCIKANLSLSPLYNGSIFGTGPRYCPSIEDKISRFSRDHHRIFLEPEGLESDLIYPNGISTSLPEEVQDEFIRLVPALATCTITQYGYAVEYDYIHPSQLHHTLELKDYPGIFLAGQINGTTGYEEAAAQGIIAGINAALKLKNKKYVPQRNESYIGVLIDDLIKNEIKEPYRILTSRAEYRTILRPDNADLRLTDKAVGFGIISARRFQAYLKREEKILELKERLMRFFLSKEELESFGVCISSNKKNVYEIVGNSNFSIPILYTIFPDAINYPSHVINTVVADSIYEKYNARHQKEIDHFLQEVEMDIPNDIDYYTMPGLSIEMQHLLSFVQPENIAELKSIPGVTPAAVVTVIMYMRRKK